MRFGRPCLLVLALAAAGCGSSASLQCDPCSSTDDCPASKTCRAGYCVSGDDDPKRCPPRGATPGSGSGSSGASGASSGSSSGGSSSSGSSSGSSSSGGGVGTFGLAAPGDIPVHCFRDERRASLFVLDQAGATVTALTAYVDGHGPHDGGAQPMRGVIYTVDDAGLPDALSCLTAEYVVASGAAGSWVTLPIDGGCPLVPGPYFLGLHTGAPNYIIRYTANYLDGGEHVADDLYADGPEPLWGADAALNPYQIAIYASYTY